MSRVSVVAKRRSYAWYLVDGDAGADATATDEYAAMCSPRGHLASNSLGEIRIVIALI